MRRKSVLAILFIYLLLWQGNIFAAGCPQDLIALPGWYETDPSFSGVDTIDLIATLRNNSGEDIEFDSLDSDTFQLWSKPGVITSMPVIINVAPSGIVLPDDTFTYELTIDVSSLPSTENVFGFRPRSITLGTMGPTTVPLVNASFSCTVSTSTSIPTLNEWGMIFMSLSMAGAALWMMRRHIL